MRAIIAICAVLAVSAPACANAHTIKHHRSQCVAKHHHKRAKCPTVKHHAKPHTIVPVSAPNTPTSSPSASQGVGQAFTSEAPPREMSEAEALEAIKKAEAEGGQEVVPVENCHIYSSEAEAIAAEENEVEPSNEESKQCV